MKRFQKGEVMIVVMVVMLAIVWFGKGHMGMMGHGDDHANKSESSRQHTGAEHSRHDDHDSDGD